MTPEPFVIKAWPSRDFESAFAAAVVELDGPPVRPGGDKFALISDEVGLHFANGVDDLTVALSVPWARVGELSIGQASPSGPDVLWGLLDVAVFGGTIVASGGPPSELRIPIVPGETVLRVRIRDDGPILPREFERWRRRSFRAQD